MAKDFAGTMKTMADMGYQYTEMCYPKGYAGAGFAPLVDTKPADLKKMIEDAGMTCPSCHFGMGNLKNNFKECMDFAHGLGLTQIITPGLDTPGKTIDDFKQACGDLNAHSAASEHLVADAADGLEDRAAQGALQLGAQPAHVDVQQVGIRIALRLPDFLADQVARQNAVSFP